MLIVEQTKHLSRRKKEGEKPPRVHEEGERADLLKMLLPNDSNRLKGLGP
jgi:hypothetical protein